MIYDAYGPRTRFAVYWTLALLTAPTLALAVVRWSRTGRLRDGIDVLWVVAVAVTTVRLLRRLKRLEGDRPQAGPEMNLAFEAVALLPLLGLVPILASASESIM